MSEFIVSCYEGTEMKQFNVPEPVYIYIKQLEAGVRGARGVKWLYRDRFPPKIYLKDTLDD
jgi:hypothetical protein